jgi:hypothetical protein
VSDNGRGIVKNEASVEHTPRDAIGGRYTIIDRLPKRRAPDLLISASGNHGADERLACDSATASGESPFAVS